MSANGLCIVDGWALNHQSQIEVKGSKLALLPLLLQAIVSGRFF